MARMEPACVLLLWAIIFWVALVEAKTGGRQLMIQDDDQLHVEVFDATPAPSAAPKLPKSHIPLLNSDFELTLVTGNKTVVATVTDTGLIPNWVAGANGVEILQSSSYQMSSFGPSVFAIHLNNPKSATNGTQGSIATLNLTADPHPATLYTVQYDCARHPEGPLNLLPVVRISTVSGSTVNYFTLDSPRINATDTPRQITWTRHSMLFMGTGAPTSIKFESMSERFGPIIDNVVLLRGVHILHPNSAPILSPAWIMLCPTFVAFTLTPLRHTQ